MLELINLYVLDCIFKLCPETLSINAKMVYINCLTHYFGDKEAVIENAMDFKIYFSENPKLVNHLSSFSELAKSGLVEVKAGEYILFFNVWYDFIAKHKLNKINPFAYVGLTISSVEEIKKDLRENQHLFEILGMKYGLTKEKYEYLIDIFVMEQLAYNKKYQNKTDLVKHFCFWIPHNRNQMPNKNTPKILGE